jgi:hypothetical protein
MKSVGRGHVEQVGVKVHDFVHGQKDCLVGVGHFANLRKVCSWALSVRSWARASFRLRAWSDRIGVTIRRSPSVEMSSSVSGVIRRSSRMGLSMMMPELFPTDCRRFVIYRS